jgi:hypothetical protein
MQQQLLQDSEGVGQGRAPLAGGASGVAALVAVPDATAVAAAGPPASIPPVAAVKAPVSVLQ